MMEDTRDPATSDPDIYAMEEDRAARVIQRAFRRLLDVNVFSYFKNLLSFKGQGDPKLLLKCINPREAGLIDAAAGVHVRFRLGGTKFPPNIYYKLFTHRPIVDMCANSPKDYTKQSVKQPLPRQVHNHGVFPEEERRGWYTRVENNGWRLLAVRLPDGLDEVTAADKKKRSPFSHSKLQRKQEVSQKQKQRKIEWMRKMYYEGSLRARTTEPSTAVLVQRATEGVLQSVEQRGPRAVLDWEVDELLNWTNALNYEEMPLILAVLEKMAFTKENSSLPYIEMSRAVTWPCPAPPFISTERDGTSCTALRPRAGGTTLVRSPYDLYEFSQLSSLNSLSLTTSEEEAE